MPLEVEPVPTKDELAAIVAALKAVGPGTEPPAPSRWRAAGRAYDDDAASAR
jgi:hypothetical protein